MTFCGNFLYSTCRKLTSKSMQNLFPYDSSAQLFNKGFQLFFVFLLLLILHCNDFIFQCNSSPCLKTDKFFIHSDFRRHISWCHFVEIMVFSNEEKAVVKNDFLEREWNTYKICKDHSTKSWNRFSIYIHLKRLQEHNSMDRRAGSSRQRIITTKENENHIENLICSQEEIPGSHMLPREFGKRHR